MELDKKSLEDRQAEIEGKFSKLKSTRDGIKEKRRDLDSQLSDIRDELVRLQGEYRQINSMLESLEEPEEKEEK